MRIAIVSVLASAAILITFAFLTPHWLKSDARHYTAKLDKLGLWRFCFHSFKAPNDYEHRRYYVGCRWIFADDYKVVRPFLLPRK